ncbi:MAG: copper amine oxidase N-terminal domain-containing protein [Clostridia bacterium]|nr:copper amine oxidase N-terminal domain-containing protein [Clostridia bacterium]
MKRLIGIILAAFLLLSVLSVTVFAADTVAYVAYNKGNDESNTGLSANSPKKSVDFNGKGVFPLVKDGGTVVVTEKMYFGESYTWKANGPVTITANYNGRNYINTSPASNPSTGSVKVKKGSQLSVASELTFDNVIIFSEHAADAIIVEDGGVLTINENVITMGVGDYMYKIVVKKGGKAIVNGGTFSSVTGLGEIVIGEKANVISDTPVVANSYAFVNFNKPGSDNNDGLSADTPKQSFGTTEGRGAAGVLAGGGTLVFPGRGYLGDSYTWNVAGDTIFTANFGGVDYKNPEPASNPTSGMFKIKGGKTFTVGSNVTFKDMILFHEGEQCTILVSGGSTLTIDESVITMSNTDRYYNIIVSAGCSAIINGGTFNSIGGAGSYVIGPKATVINKDVDITAKEYVENVVKTIYLDYDKGSNSNNGATPETAVKSYGGGVFKQITVGGTIVLSGKSVIGGVAPTNVYNLPNMAKTLTFTSVYDGVDFREKAEFLINDDTVFVISTDVVMDGLVIRGNSKESIIRVANNAALTLTDSVDFRPAIKDPVPYTIEVEKGSYLFIAPTLKDKFTIKGEGTVIDYVDGYSEIVGDRLGGKKYVELTIGSTIAVINGVPNVLDAAPINRNSRTMLPVRFLANTFGISNDGIEWNDATKTATLKNATTTIVITIGAPTMTVNGAPVALDSPAVIENSRTYLPVRVIANALGVSNDNISWNDNTKTATLIK